MADTSYQLPHSQTVALEKVHVRGEIKDFIAELEYIFSFHNREDRNIEAVYCFPLPNRAAVGRLEVKDGEVVDSCHYEIEHEYDRVLEAGGAACKLELKERSILELALGNIPAGKQVKVSLKMLIPLEIAERNAVMRLPLALAPRYVPQTYNWADNPIPSPFWHDEVPYEFSLDLTVDSRNICGIKSSSHRIACEENNGTAKVRVCAPESILERDFLLELELPQAIAPECRAGRHGDTETVAARFTFGMELPVPPVPEKNPEVILLLDCSASMTPGRFEQAAEAVELALRGMAAGDYFNLITFGSDCRVLAPSSLPYNRRNMNAALNMLTNTQPHREGSELLQALKVIDKLPRIKKSHRNIILISDGEIYNGRELLHYTHGKRHHTAIFSIITGSSSGQSALPLVSEMSGGFCEVITGRTSVSEVILRQLSRIIQIPVKNIKLRAENAMIVEPPFMPALFDGDYYSIYLEVKHCGENPQIVLEGSLRNRQIEIKAPLKEEEDRRIPVLWANSVIHAQPHHNPEPRGLAEKFDILAPDKPLMTVRSAAGETSEYYPAFRMMPIALGSEHRGGDYRHRELMAAVHEQKAAYGDDFVLELLKTQDADGTFDAEEVLSRHLNCSAGKLREEAMEVARNYFGKADDSGYRWGLTLLAARELPKNRITAPARRKIANAVKKLS